MSIPFQPTTGLVVIRAELEGPTGRATVRLALDTGATHTLIGAGPMVGIGYDPALAPSRVQVTTGSGVEYAPLVTLSRLTALGQDRAAFPVVAHTLPPSASVDGLLGLDFLRGGVLTIDFPNGHITLS